MKNKSDQFYKHQKSNGLHSRQWIRKWSNHLEEGLVLTAGHVSGEPGKKLTVVLQDGTKLEAKALGRSSAADSGLIQITKEGKYPYVELAPPASVFKGDWIYAVGHPGGFDQERGLVLRVGRVIHRSTDTIQTDCKLIGGDSGGPLFDMPGRVVGIHSRVSMKNEQNYHGRLERLKETGKECSKVTL